MDDLIQESNQDFWQVWHSGVEFNNEFYPKVKLNNVDSGIDLTVTTIDYDEYLTLFAFNLNNIHEHILVSSAMSEHTFHQHLVDLMIISLEAWELATKSNRIELAERSGIWRVSIDEGRLRTCSMDRYLMLKTLPKKPRWREVIRTAHFVLAECTLSDECKLSLNDKLAALSQHLRAQALL